MRALVTGAAGFIGSTLVDRLIADGHEVVGVDCFTPYYDRSVKESNLASAHSFEKFFLHEADLAEDPLHEILDGVTDIFHQAGQPGVRASWGRDFDEYARLNILATQRLLEAARNMPSLRSFVAASSSSVYGNAEQLMTAESVLPRPISPYGVTKLASENLCTLYGSQYGLPVVSLRYFTVYGPRQRPDMAIGRMIRCALTGDVFKVFGDGSQRRDFTFVEDAVTANLASAMVATESEGGLVFNVGGGMSVALNEVIQLVESAAGRHLRLQHTATAVGDPAVTCADPSAIIASTGWKRRFDIAEGISRTVRHAMDERNHSNR